MGVKISICEQCGGTYTSWEPCNCRQLTVNNEQLTINGDVGRDALGAPTPPVDPVWAREQCRFVIEALSNVRPLAFYER